jgi:hypothetical protein
MLMPSIEEATQIVEDIGSEGGKPVDRGILDAMVTFVQITQGLHITTQSSCEGHGDWGNPYPIVTFEVPFVRYEVPSFWRVGERREAMNHNAKHEQIAEARTTQICVVLTKMLLNYYLDRHVDPENMFHIVRTGATSFAIQPVYIQLSHAYKVAGDYSLLEDLLATQGDQLFDIAEHFFREFDSTKSFVGIPPDGCLGCFGVIG